MDDSPEITLHHAHQTRSMRSLVVMKLEAARLSKCYAALDQRLEDRDYLLDGGFSVADISCGYSICSGRHFTHIEPFRQFSSWYARLRAHLHVNDFDEAPA